METILSSWYPLIRSIDLKHGKTTTLDVFGNALVLFRTKNNLVGALSRRCPHMGGDLSRGQVTEHGVACPIHHWEFNPDGLRINANDSGCTNTNAPLACQTSLPCIERWGIIFAFLGEKPFFDLPDIEAPIYCGTPTMGDMDMNYTVPSLFGFDNEHFLTVHHRHLTTMTVNPSQKHGHISMQIRASVGVDRWSDRLMHRLGFNEVESDIDFWAGNILLGRHAKTGTYALITTLPLEEHRSRIFFVPLQEIPNGNWLKRFGSWCRFQLAKPLIQAFVRQDELALNGIRFDVKRSKHRKDNQIELWIEHVNQLPTIATSELLNR